jgi:RHS repeat-associated protein
VGKPADQDLISRTAYDAAGRRLQAIDPAGRVTEFAYDNQDHLIAVTENAVSGSCVAAPCNIVTQYHYDRLGNRTAIVDARGNIRRFTYDTQGRVVRATDALGQVTEREYDGAGRIQQEGGPRNSNFDRLFTPDNMGRLSEIYALEFAGIIAQGYDALGRRTSSSSPYTPGTTYHYDGLNRLIEVRPYASASVRSSYDAAGRRTQLIYPDSTTLDYEYWADGQLKAVKQGATTLASYSYDTAGRLQTLTRANGATTSYSYDAADRLTDVQTQVSSTTRSRFQYGLDRLGQRTSTTETLAAATRTLTYTYDGLQRLTGATESPGTTYTYTYDLAGNRTGVWVNGTQVVSQTFDAANQVVGWTYDAAGNLLDDGTSQSSYDPMGWLMATTSGGQTRSYAYDADGTLATQTTSGSTISYTQDLAAPLSQVLQITDGVTTTEYLYGAERLAAVKGGTRTWYGGDALGSVRQTLSDTGTSLGSVNYDPWGTVESGTVPTFGFTGELQDVTTGLVNLRARWYSTAHSTFISRDSFAGFPEQPYSLHPYQYGYSDPVLYSDPSGKTVHCDIVYPYPAYSPDVRRVAKATGIHCAGGRVVNHSSSAIRISGAFVNPACTTADVIKEINDHPTGDFPRTRCIKDGTTNLGATEDYHVLFPGESSDDYGYVDADGISPLTEHSFPGQYPRRLFREGDSIYDSSYRYHPLNSDTATVEDDDGSESGKYLRVSAWLRGYANVRLSLTQLCNTVKSYIGGDQASVENVQVWNRWNMSGKMLNDDYPKRRPD